MERTGEGEGGKEEGSGSKKVRDREAEETRGRRTEGDKEVGEKQKHRLSCQACSAPPPAPTAWSPPCSFFLEAPGPPPPT